MHGDPKLNTTLVSDAAQREAVRLRASPWPSMDGRNISSHQRWLEESA
jgi:hypothetical protein